jgi:SDR family mycofactocin-dependent oxidoreductase
MQGRVQGKVAFVTGAARGQGRSMAIRLAEEGAAILAVDILGDYETVPYGLSRAGDLDETVELVEKAGGRIVARRADVRDKHSLVLALALGVEEFGRLDVVVANAGICTVQPWHELTHQVWQDTLDTNLTGVWNTMSAAAPHLISSGGGSMIAINSTAGLKGLPFVTAYSAAKHGVVGVCRSLANELAEHLIRVNTVHPTGVESPMTTGLGGLRPLLEHSPVLGPLFANTFPVDYIEPHDIANAVLFLASDESRYITGLELTVDAGNTIR